MHIIKTFIILIVVIFSVPSMTAQTVTASGELLVSASESAGVGEHVVHTAMKYLGVRYRRGASGPNYFDCSGFTRFVYRQKNVPLTRSSSTQYHEGKPILKISELQPGDLVFFAGSNASGSVGHVGIVTELKSDSSDFSFVHASRTGVKVDVLSSAYYKKRYMGARRVL